MHCLQSLLFALEVGKHEMIDNVNARLAARANRDGLTARETDPEALTIGFARRFATYKRATLLLSDIERMKRIATDAGRPVQFVFAGKAHPADSPGKEYIQALHEAAEGELAGYLFVLEDYDMDLARRLVQGVDLWLNNPRRPLEASGTSGQKASLNGAPNFSVLDGWWPEAYNGENGWTIGEQKEYGSTEEHPHGEDVIFYLTVYNEPVEQPAEPEDLDLDGLLRGLHHVSGPVEDAAEAPRAQLLASGVGFPWIRQAQQMLAEEWGVATDLWSVTSWNELAREALECEEWNLLHPDQDPRVPWLRTRLEDVEGPVVAVSDYMSAVPLQISRWVPADYRVLGTDGFGFADTRPAARRHFHVDAESVVVQTLQALADAGQVERGTVAEAFKKYRIDDPTAVAGVKQEGGDA